MPEHDDMETSIGVVTVAWRFFTWFIATDGVLWHWEATHFFFFLPYGNHRICHCAFWGSLRVWLWLTGVFG